MVRRTLSYGVVKFLWAFIVSVCSLSSLGNQPDCQSIEAIDVTGREFVNPGVAYQTLQQNLVDGLLKQAVEQVIGKQITTNVRQELKVHNDELESTLRELNVERAKGYIRGYDIHPPGAKIIEMGGQSLMEIGLNVRVCMPKYRGVNYVMAVGQVLDNKGQPIQSGTAESIIAEITKNPRFSAVRLPAPKDTYYDYALSVRLKSAGQREIANVGGQLGAKLMKALTKKTQRYEEKIAQISVEVSLQLENVADRTITNYIGRGTTETKRRPNKQQQTAAIAAALDEAAIKAVKKMMDEI